MPRWLNEALKYIFVLPKVIEIIINTVDAIKKVVKK